MVDYDIPAKILTAEMHIIIRLQCKDIVIKYFIGVLQIDAHTLSQWKEICNLSLDAVTRFYICEDHIHSSDYDCLGRKRLLLKVIPKLPIEISVNIDNRQQYEKS